MQEDVVKLISCPKCNGDIEIIKRIEIIEQNNITFLKSSLLNCKRCNSLYPVIDRIPRILMDEEFSQAEKKAITDYLNLSTKRPKILIEPVIDKDEKYKIIENLVKEKLQLQLQFKSIESEKIREKMKRAINYRVYQTEKKERFVNTCIPYLTKKPEVIVDIGGGQGGTISYFSRYFTPKIGILIDIDLRWAKIALIRDPMVNVIRADASKMPLKSQSIDFLITTATLEHISSWEKTIEEIARVSKNAFISYNPNKWFFCDWGHVKAPLVTVLPKRIGAGVAYLFHKLIRTGYTYKIVRNEIENTYYISRHKVMNILGEYGTVKNVFPEFLYHSINSNSYVHFGRLKSFLKSHPKFLKFSSKFAVTLGIEPNVYLFFKRVKTVK